ncbi:MAG: aspartate aminotransferase [Bdellovibrionales bacterium RIFOXYC1_FULL_54_43]|nr:MAG: aspartate aminotransferase [Bdellovibrionales bacterium RIFOXYC1_FULL_54_43]OFZ82454.1 MAG: aspartate aminotransferase [Bdellovibrionales bacterium RIFOXYD1_FULL_55_31]
MKLLAGRMKNLGSENAFKVGDDIRRAEQAGMKVIRFNLGEPDFNSADFINQVAVDHIHRGNSHYCPPAGIESLRRAVAKQISETRGIEIHPDHVVVTVGAKPPIGYALMSYVNAGDEVIYPSPGFPIYESWITYLGAKAVPLHLDEKKGFSFTADELEKLITRKTKLIFINSPSNPTGGVLAEEELAKIAQVIRKKCDENVRVYSDEVYEHIIFDGLKHHSIISQRGMQDRTVLVSGHSKSFAMTGWRLGYAILPTLEEAAIFKNLNINNFSCTPPFIQEAGREAIENPSSTETVRRMVHEFQQRRDYVIDALNSIEGISCANPKGAFYAFPNIKGVCENLGAIEKYKKLPKSISPRTSPATLFQKFLLYRHGVATMDRRSFGQIGSKGKHFIRISMATDIDSLKLGIVQLEKASKDRDGFAKFVKEAKHLY